MRIDARFTLLAVTMLAMTGCSPVRDPMQDWLKAGYSDRYRAPSATESAVLSDAFARGMHGIPPGPVDSIGYELERVGAEHALREAAPRERGWGAYLLRTGAARELVVQAPHAESDLRTGTIAYALYRATNARVLALNSAHRSQPGADQANAAGSPFALLGREAARASGGAIVIQIHGYGARTASEHGLDSRSLVLSNGTRTPDPALRELAACLVRAGFDARLFPEEAAYPGGTRNAVRAAMAAIGAGRFVHVELGESLRTELDRDPVRAQALAACL